MAGVSGFEHDIFISYSRVDNETASEEEKGWVTLFIDNLSINLRRSGVKAEIWFDKNEIDKSMAFNPVLDEAIKNSAILLSLTSHSSLESKYCAMERELFYKKAESEPHGLHINHRFRIINVQLNRFPKSLWPQEFSGKEGFQFYNSTGPEDTGFALLSSKSEFTERIQELAREMKLFLHSFQGKNEQTASASKEIDTLETEPVKPPLEEKTIYFGDAQESLGNLKTGAIHDLTKRGYRISMDYPQPSYTSGDEKSIVNNLKNVDLSVHLFNEKEGLDIKGLSTSFGQKQAELAISNAPYSFIWVPRDLDVEQINDGIYKDFIRSVKSGSYNPDFVEYITGDKSKGDLTQKIEAKLSQIEREKMVAEVTAQSKVLVDTHLSDQHFAEDLRGYLEMSGADTIFNPPEGDPRKVFETWQSRINEVNKLVFLYGKVDEVWVKQRVKEAAKVMIEREVDPESLDMAILLLPDEKHPEEIDFLPKHLKVNIIDNSQSVNLSIDNLQQLVKVKAA